MKRGAVLGIVLAGTVVVGAGLAWWLLSRPPGPDETARAFLEALAAGDGDRALALAEPPAGDVDIATALGGASAYLTDPAVVGVEKIDDGAARAAVTFTLDGEDRSVSFGLVERDGGWIVAADAFGALSATTTLGEAVLAGGVPVRAGSEVALLPAVYPVQAAPEGVLTGAMTVAVLPGETTTAEVAASVSPEATRLAQEQLDAYAGECTTTASAVPPHCGLRVPWAADLATLDSIAFRVEALPQVALSPDLRTFAATSGIVVATATGTTRDGGSASFTYRADDWALRGTIALSADEMQLAVG
jgi:hypothetical protein